MDLDQIITITKGEESFTLPLKNLLRLALVYSQPLYKEIFKTPEQKELWKTMQDILKVKLDIPEGGKVLT